jgi:hypothetical protein
MKTIMDTYKTVISKLSLSAFALFLAAGCATVTDANIDLPEENNDNITTVEKAGDVWDQKTGNDMDPIIVKPEMTD